MRKQVTYSETYDAGTGMEAVLTASTPHELLDALLRAESSLNEAIDRVKGSIERKTV